VVCPVDCCVPNPDDPETEAQLLTKARAIHPEHDFPPDFPSRFRRKWSTRAGSGDLQPSRR
jgi:hypothetical protein